MKDGMAFPYRNPRRSPRKKFQSGQVPAGLGNTLERVGNLRETFPFPLAHPPSDANAESFRCAESTCGRKEGRAAFPPPRSCRSFGSAMRPAPVLDGRSGRRPPLPRARAAKELDEGENFP